MSQSSRISAAVVFLLALGFSWSAAASGHEMLQQTLTQSVRAAMQSTGSDVDVRVIEEAAIRAKTLSSLQIDSAASQPTITFGFSAVPLYTVRMEQAPARLVVDFIDTIVLSDLQKIVIDRGNMVGGVDTTIAVLEPQFITRVIVGLPKACAFDVHQKGAALTVTLQPATPIDAASAVQGTDAATLGLAAIEEGARRTDAACRDRLAELDQKIYAAAQFIERAKVALIKADLAELSPVADAAEHGAATENLRQETASQGNRTRQLERGLQQLLSHRDMNRTQAQMDIAAQRADENSAGSILERFSKNERTFGEDLAKLLTQMDRQARANERLAMRLEQLGAGNTALVGGLHTEAKLNQLDRAFLALSETARPAEAIDDSLTALDSAMESVLTAPVYLAHQDETRMAVLANTTGAQDTLAAPPAPRPRQARREFNTNRIENPIKMAVLSSSSSDVETAAHNGILVMAQQETTGITEAQGRPSTPIQVRTDTSGPRRYRVPKTSGARPQFSLYNEDMPADQDPLRQLVNIDFREMDLSNVVSLLAQKGEINVIAGTEVSGTVTANLKNIPLGRAIEIVLRLNGLGIVEEAGVYRITTYDEAISMQRETKMIFLKNAQADEVKATLDDVLVNATNGDLISVSANAATNVVILSGPREAVEQLEGVVAELDVAEPVVPTIIVPIKLNYSEPMELLLVVNGLLSELGSVTADPRSRHIIVTDIPVKVQEIQALIAAIDLPVKQVSIDAMIVDAQLDDDAQTGLDWILNSVSSEQQITASTFEIENGLLTTNTEGNFVPKLGISNAFLPTNAASQIFFKVLGGDIDLSAIIAAEVTSRNAKLLANPTITTIENKPAIIRIVQEFPYQELTQTSEGGSIGSTKFKEIGTVLEVTPRVTHDNNIIAEIDAKESTVVGFTVTEVPIEAKRQAQTTLRLADGQTIFIGGMRSFEDRLTVRKTPILGDIPILNLLFTNKRSQQTNTELMIFLTCNVLPDDMPELTPYEKGRFDELGGTPQKVDGTRVLVESYIHPERQRDPFYKWKRTK
ncbi:MAG: secretin N-terminal domain-containing protein [Candidatus Hydrogenedentes bacterium]|nr:secretin N-terminal domain-containing protein [Candidatus Hydrogenedentota bacterium]